MIVSAYAVACPSWPTADAATWRFRDGWLVDLPMPPDSELFFETAPSPLGGHLAPLERPTFRRLIAKIGADPRPRTLVVNKLDALGQNLREVDQSVSALAALVDRTVIHALDGCDRPVDLTPQIAAVMRACVRLERQFVAVRTRVGQAAAVRRGKQLGRPYALDFAACTRIRDDLADGASIRATARKYGVAEGTIRSVREGRRCA